MWTLLNILVVSVSASQLCEFHKSVELTNRTYAGVTFGSNETYVDPKTHQERGCVCLKGTCARKCCPFGQAYNSSSYRCINFTDEFNPPVTEQRNSVFKVTAGFNATKEFIFMTGKMACDKDAGEKRLLAEPGSKSFNLITNGNLYVDVKSNKSRNLKIYEPDKYCIDMMVSTSKQLHLDALICYIEETGSNHYLLSSTCMLVSCFFILLTVAVYAVLPELRNLPGMVLMVHLLCVFVGFLLLATLKILALWGSTTKNTCIVLTFIIYFFLLAAFFWLNIMCYDIWRTLSCSRTLVPGPQLERFMYYAMYAFGIPSALTVTLVVLEFSDLPNYPPMLKIRMQSCFMDGTTKLLYLYIPIVIICAANMTFFGLTTFKLWKTTKQTRMLHGKESRTHSPNRKEIQRFIVCVKLFTTTGISWILEVISFLYPDADFFWQFSDAFNVLLGLIIFIIFVCKKNIWEMIKNRFYRSH